MARASCCCCYFAAVENECDKNLLILFFPSLSLSLSLSCPSYSELGRWKRKSSCFGLLGRLAVAVRKKRTSLITSTFYFTSASQVISSAVLSCSKKDRAKRRLRYCNRRRRPPLMKLRQIQNLPSAITARPTALYGDRKMPTCPDSKTNQRTKWHSLRHCLSTFVPYPPLTRREREIVDGLIAGQKRQWSGGDGEERDLKCEWPLSAAVTTMGLE